MVSLLLIFVGVKIFCFCSTLCRSVDGLFVVAVCESGNSLFCSCCGKVLMICVLLLFVRVEVCFVVVGVCRSVNGLFVVAVCESGSRLFCSRCFV